MKLLDLTFPSPAENLAADEVLLAFCEDGGCTPGILRFWEPEDCFVVAGYANRIEREVNRAECAANGISIFRRCSGGGAVLQGPGCLNYTLILPSTQGTPLEGITTANRFIMEQQKCACEAALRSSGHSGVSGSVSVRGHTDLVWNDLKFSGNAQRRKNRFLLFHGTFLLRFDIGLVEKFLPQPSRQPEYRANRRHGEFLTNLPAPVATVKKEVARIWEAGESLGNFPRGDIPSLARHRYLTDEWNFRF